MSFDLDKKDRRAVVEGVGEYLAEAVRNALDQATKCCLNCDNFQPDNGEKCGLNGLVPPPSIAARGCECWEDPIPF